MSHWLPSNDIRYFVLIGSGLQLHALHSVVACCHGGDGVDGICTTLPHCVFSLAVRRDAHRVIPSNYFCLNHPWLHHHGQLLIRAANEIAGKAIRLLRITSSLSAIHKRSVGTVAPSNLIFPRPSSTIQADPMVRGGSTVASSGSPSHPWQTFLALTTAICRCHHASETVQIWRGVHPCLT
jgi:hypothetical protein